MGQGRRQIHGDKRLADAAFAAEDRNSFGIHNQIL
jgi:hypothetical protein